MGTRRKGDVDEMPPSITRRRLLALAGASAVGGALLPRAGGTAHDSAEVDAWNHPRANPRNTASIAQTGPSDPDTTWTRRFDQSNLFRFEGCALVDDRLLVPAHDRLRALSSETGDTRWSITLPTDRRREHHQLDSAPRVHGDLCLVASLSAVYAIDIASGDARWRFELNSSTDGLTLLGNTAYVSALLDGEHRLVALDVTSGRERWRTDGQYVPLAADEDAIVVGSPTGRSEESRLVAFDPETGTREWTSDETLSEGRHRQRRSGVAIGENTLFVTDSGTLRAFDRDDGRHQWDVPLGDEESTFLDRIAVDGDVFVVRPDVDRVLRVNRSGAIGWDREFIGAEHGISVGADHVYVARRSGVSALDPETDESVFAVDVADTPGHGWTPVIDEGTVYGIAGDTVYRVSDDE
jgi:outer membrane protein assembly factor BamB